MLLKYFAIRTITIVAVIAICSTYAAGDPAAQVEARQIAAQASANRQARLPGYGDDLRNAATRLLNVGLPVEAMTTVQLVIDDPESELDQAIGQIIRADIYESQGLHIFAKSALLQSIDHFNQSQHLRKLIPEVYARMFGRLANSYFLTGDPDTALALADNLIAAVPNNLPQSFRETTLYNRVTYARFSSTPSRVIDSIDGIFQFNPGFDHSDGSNISLRLERALAIDNRTWSPLLIIELQNMWADATLRLQPQILDVGSVLVNAYRSLNSCEDALDVASRSLVLLDSSRSGWIARDQPPFDSEWMDQQTIQLLSVLHSGNACQKPWLTAWALQRMFNSDHWSDQDALTQTFVDFVNNLSVLDGSTPPSGLGVFPDLNGSVFPEAATVLVSSFVDDSAVPVRINGGGPMRLTSSQDWTSGFNIYAGSEDGTSWTSVNAFRVRAPFDPLVAGAGQFIGLSRKPGVEVRSGVYAIVPKSTVKWDANPNLPTADCPSVTWSTTPFGSLPTSSGAYVFRIAPDCDSNATNDFLQISLALAADPPQSLDLNSNGVLDTCELANPCRVDINGDHLVSVSDIFDFLNFWFVLDTRGDFNLDGQISPSDIFAFLNAWFSFAGPC
ncbi:MAG: hypothetical protein K2W85_13945 [Phycisphaerales bacterium]|nr:hypothetical protein [Phycisphaerales bacterium]